VSQVADYSVLAVWHAAEDCTVWYADRGGHVEAGLVVGSNPSERRTEHVRTEPVRLRPPEAAAVQNGHEAAPA